MLGFSTWEGRGEEVLQEDRGSGALPRALNWVRNCRDLGKASLRRPLEAPFVFCRMNVGVAHSEVNPNTRVMNSRGIWLAYVISVGVLHIVLLSIPFFSIPVVWTLTNVIHNLVSDTPPSAPGPESMQGGLRWGWLGVPSLLQGTEGKSRGLALKGPSLGKQHKAHFCASSSLSWACFTSPLPLEPAGHVPAAAHGEGDPV